MVSSQSIGASLYYSGTASSETILDWYLYVIEKQTASDITFTYSLPIATESSQATINELKKLSGLTWEQLAKIFNVSRRSLHFWASGKPISPFNEEHLRRLLATIRYINRGSADINRSALLEPRHGSMIPLDLLVAGKYEEVKQLLGAGKAVEETKLKPLSSEAADAHCPQLPEDLVGALHEPVHREVRRSRSAKTTRSRKGGGSQ
ncbi:MAG: XRE family transcriptional regulator [Acaryochloris sp. RU_4_1]|nr:XRE family transcriptional regulator [Leptolyngbyaceae cyanobacterium SU_3_3]NJM66128.1 XRE family transcriptional regulator [Acaryochloris sp. RU_4_1]NJR54820.1 XRE family transcriptional regulator [Acaryochloris sp. CRU_2_0]